MSLASVGVLAAFVAFQTSSAVLLGLILAFGLVVAVLFGALVAVASLGIGRVTLQGYEAFAREVDGKVSYNRTSMLRSGNVVVFRHGTCRTTLNSESTGGEGGTHMRITFELPAPVDFSCQMA